MKPDYSKRMTRFSEKYGQYVTGNIREVVDEVLFETDTVESNLFIGDAVEKLAILENWYERLVTRQQELHEEMEVLRLEGKEKTVRFREMMAEKLTNEMIVSEWKRLW